MRAWRSRLKISQEELAERASLHRTYISDVERGARNLSLESIDKLAVALQVSVATLFSSEPPSPGGSLPITLSPDELVDILLVEDDPNDVALTIQAFEVARITNRVYVVSDGAEALEFLFCTGAYAHRKLTDRPQVILLDLELPRIGGIEVLRRIKADERTRSIPVVVLTASQQDRDIADSKRLEAAAYIVKPVDFRNLTEVTPLLSLQWALLKRPAALSA